jgi:hypothetical protein
MQPVRSAHVNSTRQRKFRSHQTHLCGHLVVVEDRVLIGLLHEDEVAFLQLLLTTSLGALIGIQAVVALLVLTSCTANL